MQKPMSLARRDYIDSLCDLTNKCGLPAFAVVDVLERVLSQMRAEAEAEIKRDEAIWHKAMSAAQETKEDG